MVSGTRIIALPVVQAVVRLSDQWLSVLPLMFMRGEEAAFFPTGAILAVPSIFVHSVHLGHSLGHTSVLEIAVVHGNEQLQDADLRAFGCFACFARQTLQSFSWSMAVVYVKPVNVWSDTATNWSEISRSCCNVSVAWPTQMTRFSKLDADLVFMKLRALQLRTIVCSHLDCLCFYVALSHRRLKRYMAGGAGSCSDGSLVLSSKALNS